MRSILLLWPLPFLYIRKTFFNETVILFLKQFLVNFKHQWICQCHKTEVKTLNVVKFVWKCCIAIVVKWLKLYGFGAIPSTNCLNKYLPTKSFWYYKTIFSSTTPMLSLKLSFMSAKDRVNLNIFSVTLFILWQRNQCIVLTVQCFYLWRNKAPSVFLSTIRENRILNPGNQYHKDTT